MSRLSSEERNAQSIDEVRDRIEERMKRLRALDPENHFALADALEAIGLICSNHGRREYRPSEAVIGPAQRVFDMLGDAFAETAAAIRAPQYSCGLCPRRKLCLAEGQCLSEIFAND